jgi:hypothetical protein
MYLSFIISVCIRNIQHFNQLKRCIESIKLYHCESNIFLINDSDDSFNKCILEYIEKFENIKIIQSKLKGSADQQVFKIILENDDKSSHYIIIQDSMILNKALEEIELIENIKFMWHFTNHMVDWDRIIEPQTEYNMMYNIITHSDLIKHNLKNNYFQDEKFLEFALQCLEQKESWVGCFGNCCVITRKCVKYLNDKTQFSEKFIQNYTNRERRANESIFSLICHYYLPQDYSNSYDGLYYDGINVNNFAGKVTEFDNSLVYCCKNKYISKLSFCR